MSNHERAPQQKMDENQKKNHVNSMSSEKTRRSEKEHHDEKPVLTDTPFTPRMDEHVALLTEMPFAVQRQEFITRLHRTYGSRYVQRLVESMNIRAKLTVSDPGDVYEQEADRVADTVTESIKSQAQRQLPEEDELQGKANVSRQSPEEDEELMQGKLDIGRQVPEEDEELMQGKLDIGRQAPEEEEELQTQPDMGSAATASDSIETRIDSARGGGHPLPDEVIGPMEQAFGTDFSGVRTHTDSEADALNHEISAKAFTTGNDIFFREGEYSPGSDSGKHLLAHELTHVVQQTGSSVKRDITAQRQDEEEEGAVAVEDMEEEEEVADEEIEEEEEEEGEAGPLDPAVVAEIEKQVAALEDPSQIPEEDQVKEAQAEGEEQGKRIEAVASANKPLAELLLLDMQQKAAEEPEPPKGLKARFRAWRKGPGKPAKKLRKKRRFKFLKRGASKVMKGVKQASRIAVLIKKIPGPVSYFFSFLSMAADLKSGRSTAKKYAALDEALEVAEREAIAEFGAVDPQMKEVIGAVKFAMSKKYRKWWRRLASFMSTLTVTGVSLAVLAAGKSLTVAGISALLASNPVGWGIALALGGIALLGGLAILGHKIYRWWKKKKAFALGKDRAEAAATLYSALTIGKEPASSLAKDAVNILGLPADLMVEAYNEAPNSKTRMKVTRSSIKDIMNKLKSV